MDSPAPSSETTPPSNSGTRAPNAELQLAGFTGVLAVALCVFVALGAAIMVGVFGWLGFPPIAAPGEKGLSLARLFDLVKIAFGLIAGVGGVIALVAAYRRQKVAEAAEHRQQAAERRADQAHLREDTKLFNERFTAVAGQLLGHEAPAVRLAGVHALAGLADDAPTRELRQTLIDVLCAYLRMPYTPQPADDAPQNERLEFAGLREVRHTVIRVITAHLREGASVSWQGHDFDFTGVVFDGGDLSGAVFSGGEVSFNQAKFSGGTVSSGLVTFSGGAVVDFRSVADWSCPPLLPDPLPNGILLPNAPALPSGESGETPDGGDTGPDVPVG